MSPRQVALYAALYMFENAAYRLDRALRFAGYGRRLPIVAIGGRAGR